MTLVARIRLLIPAPIVIQASFFSRLDKTLLRMTVRVENWSDARGAVMMKARGQEGVSPTQMGWNSLKGEILPLARGITPRLCSLIFDDLD